MNEPNTNQNTDQKINDAVPKQFIEAGYVSYTVSGLVPTQASWRLTEDQVKNIIRNISKSLISDLQQVTLEINHKNGSISAFIWIPSDSKNLKDDEMMKGNSAVARPITRYSKELKEFMDKFCENNKKRTVGDMNGSRLSGIEVMIERFLNIEFDKDGNKYFNVVHGKKVRTNVDMTCHFSKGRDGEFGRLNYIEVKKGLKAGFKSDPAPKRSFNAVR